MELTAPPDTPVMSMSVWPEAGWSVHPPLPTPATLTRSPGLQDDGSVTVTIDELVVK